jgi:hypothetical protein
MDPEFLLYIKDPQEYLRKTTNDTNDTHIPFLLAKDHILSPTIFSVDNVNVIVNQDDYCGYHAL